MNLVVGVREPTRPLLQADLETAVGVGDFGTEALAKRLQRGEYDTR